MPTRATWEIKPDEYMGTDLEGCRYYRLHGDIFKVNHDHTRWFCTMGGWACALKCLSLTKEGDNDRA